MWKGEKMISGELKKKIAAFGITASLILLIFLVLTPPSITAVYLHPGTPNYTSIATTSFVTFNNVNFTIRKSETIPVKYLDFSIRKSSDNSELEHVTFSIQGTEISDPNGKFIVTLTKNTSSIINQSTGHYGYDERTGQNYTFNYGYGPSNNVDLTILYTIRYTTSTLGTYYAQLYVNTTTHTYASGSSTSFTVQTSGGGGGTPTEGPQAHAGGPYTGVVGTLIQFNGSQSTSKSGTTITSYTWVFGDGTTAVGVKPTHIYITAGTYAVRLTVADNTGATDTDTATATISSIAPPAPSVKATNQTLQAVNSAFGLSLQTQFYASDTNGDGIVDVFTDPNNKLNAVNVANVNSHAVFLLSTNSDNIPEFFWDTANNTMTSITHAPAPLTTPFINTAAKTVTIEITVNKTGWIYIDITDQYPIEDYPQYTFTVKAGDRVISSDRIWRKDGKVYILDDPVTSYDLIYVFTILPPTFNPLSDTTVTTARPTITITYPQQVAILSAVMGTTNITYQFITTDNKVFTYTPSTDLSKGTHTISVTVKDTAGDTLTSSATYTVNLPTKPGAEFPVWIIVVIIAIIIILIVAVILLRRYAFI